MHTRKAGTGSNRLLNGTTLQECRHTHPGGCVDYGVKSDSIRNRPAELESLK